MKKGAGHGRHERGDALPSCLQCSGLFIPETQALLGENVTRRIPGSDILQGAWPLWKLLLEERNAG